MHNKTFLTAYLSKVLTFQINLELGNILVLNRYEYEGTLFAPTSTYIELANILIQGNRHTVKYQHIVIYWPTVK